ncbi:hypothetical protein SLEP1_g59651 [Rubroshorea leprosula]|uniref:Uncharacterized protein n=1 Tax=Rubroshorea leprosula TaxID=152421 RepID=A0AAV5MU92_9ROSI|nr:hypothetical protein SLEP1_g59651 [Rubroshorea leprosula]
MFEGNKVLVYRLQGKQRQRVKLSCGSRRQQERM